MFPNLRLTYTVTFTKRLPQKSYPFAKCIKETVESGEFLRLDSDLHRQGSLSALLSRMSAIAQSCLPFLDPSFPSFWDVFSFSARSLTH